LHQSLKMSKNKDPPWENPSPRRKAFPSNKPRPCWMRGLLLVDSWSSRPGEPFAGLPKCSRGEGQKDVSCVGLRGRVPGRGGAPGGVSVLSRGSVRRCICATIYLYIYIYILVRGWGSTPQLFCVAGTLLCFFSIYLWASRCNLVGFKPILQRLRRGFKVSRRYPDYAERAHVVLSREG
jgi:hypothetical protein